MEIPVRDKVLESNPLNVALAWLGRKFMKLAGFLKSDPSAGAELPDDGANRGDAMHGLLIGCFASMVLWFVPLPVVIIVWLFERKGPFGDYMLMAIPFFLGLPIIGLAAGYVSRR